MVRTTTLLVTLYFLSACTIPGMKMSLENKNMILQEDQHISIDSMANIFPITPMLLDKMEQERKSRAQKPHGVLPRDEDFSDYTYRINSGDVLDVLVWGYPELMAPLQAEGSDTSRRNGFGVDEQGNMFYPYVGLVHVAGKTVGEVRELLTKKLARYIRHPQIAVNMASFRSQRVYVGGAVKKTTSVPLSDRPITILDAIGYVGGVEDDADMENIRWTHQGQTRIVSVQQMMKEGIQNYLLSHGDTVYVPSTDASKVFVMGEVMETRTLRIGSGGIHLTGALSDAGGISQNAADATGVFVIRMNPSSDKEQRPINVYQLNLSDATALALGTRFTLMPDDVVYVTAAPVTRWNRLLAQIIPSVSALQAGTASAESLRNAGVFR